MKLIDVDMLCKYCDNNINHSITPNEIMRMPFVDAEPVEVDKLISENEELRKENAALKLLLEWAEEAGFGYDQIPEEYAEFKDDLERLDIGYIEGFIYMAKKRVEQGCRAWIDKIEEN